MQPAKAQSFKADHQKRDANRYKRVKQDFNTISTDITIGQSKNDNLFQYEIRPYEFVCVGSYVIKASTVRFWYADINTDITVTELGFRLSLPCPKRGGQQPWERRVKTVCLPVECILDMKCTLHGTWIIIFIITGLKYASWLRKNLELDPQQDDNSSRYFCPQQGNKYQKQIIFVIKDATFKTTHILEKFYSSVFKKIEKDTTINILRRSVLQSVSFDLLKLFERDNIRSGNEMFNSKNHCEDVQYDSCKKNPQLNLERPKNCLEVATYKRFEKKNKTLWQNRKVIPFYLNRDEIKSKYNDESKTNDKISSTSTEWSTTCKIQQKIINLDKKLLSYKGPMGFNFNVFTVDLLSLQKSEFLNDQIIDFWLTVVQMEYLSAEIRDRVFVFDSYFYKSFSRQTTPDNIEERFTDVKTRTKLVDIFLKDYLIIPINENLHWILAIVCFFGLDKDLVINSRYQQNEGPFDQEQKTNNSSLRFGNYSEISTAIQKTSSSTSCILIFDSINDNTVTHENICRNIRKYLEAEWKCKINKHCPFDEVSLPRKICVLPKQQNGFDCGLFLLHYVEMFFRKPIQSFDSDEIDLYRWFSPSDVTNDKRQQIYNFIAEQVKLYFPENQHLLPKLTF